MHAVIERGTVREETKALKGMPFLEVALVVSLYTEDDIRAAQEFIGVAHYRAIGTDLEHKKDGGLQLVIRTQRPLDKPIVSGGT